MELGASSRETSVSLGNIDLNPQLIQAVRDAVDVVSVASENTRLTKAGNRYKGLCPLHKEKTPSFSVDPERGLFYCFGCGAGGDAIRLHMLTSGDDFPAAIETLARRYGIRCRPPVAAGAGTNGSSRRSSGRRRILQGPAEPHPFGPAVSGETEDLQRAHRALRPGVCPGGLEEPRRSSLRQGTLRGSRGGGSSGALRKAGGRPYDRFRHRLIFPIRNASGRLLGFGGRTLGDDRAKYINTQETEQFRKGLLLYGLYEGKRSLRDSGKAVLVEGYFDVLGTVASGVEGAVASMGTSLTSEQGPAPFPLL